MENIAYYIETARGEEIVKPISELGNKSLVFYFKRSGVSTKYVLTSRIKTRPIAAPSKPKG